MEWTLFRRFLKPTYTIGSLYVGDRYLCNTLEDRVRDLSDYNHDGDFDDSGEGKVYGQTAIPPGRYQVILSYSAKLKRILPLLLKVPGFTGIRIHKGITDKHTEGCILVGENKIRGGLENSPYYETVIIKLIRDITNKREEVWLTIKQ